MGVYIKGVSLADFKPICPCLNGDYGCCDIPGIKRCYGIGNKGCPLVEIPPHGRLIDADALDAYLKTAAIMADGESKEAYIDARAEAKTMPTIIPADKEEQT